jgi:hypothetical protein
MDRVDPGGPLPEGAGRAGNVPLHRLPLPGEVGAFGLAPIVVGASVVGAERPRASPHLRVVEHSR